MTPTQGAEAPRLLAVEFGTAGHHGGWTGCAAPVAALDGAAVYAELVLVQHLAPVPAAVVAVLAGAMLAALDQRIAIRHNMPPMTSEETASYVAHPDDQAEVRVVELREHHAQLDQNLHRPPALRGNRRPAYLRRQPDPDRH